MAAGKPTIPPFANRDRVVIRAGAEHDRADAEQRCRITHALADARASDVDIVVG